MNKWKQYSFETTACYRRGGWLGVWDAIVSAVTGQPRRLIEGPVTISFWAKSGANVSFNQVQTEWRDVA